MLVSEINRNDVGAKILLQVALDKGLQPDQVLEGTGLDNLADPNSQLEVTVEQELKLIRNFLRHLGDIPNIGLEVGSRYHLTSRGVWGFAVASSLTFRRAAQLATQFYDLTEFLASFQLRREGGYYVLDICADHLDEDVRDFVLERDLAAWVNYTREMRPGGLPFMAVELRHKADRELDLYCTLFGGMEPGFGAERNAIFIDSACMELRLSQADPAMSKMYAELCRQHINRRRYKGGMVERVKEILLESNDEIPGVEQVASRLCMASRSLRRRLSEEGTSFRAVVDEVRESLAEEMLTTDRVKLEEVASRLGYSEPSSFVHAFKRWKGVSPAQYRRSLMVA